VLLLGGCGSNAPLGSTPPTTRLRTCPVPAYLPVPDIPWACPPAEEVVAINRDVRISFEQDPTAGILVCTAADGSANLSRLQERTYQAILLMKNIQFDTPLPWTSLPLYDWFIQTIDAVRFRTDIDTSFCCDPPRVINIIAARQYNTGFPDIPLEVLVHEARHVEMPRHTCGQDQDRNISDLGGYGVQYYLMQWLGEHSLNLLSPAERAYSLNRAENLKFYSFCNECY